ncbi:MAG: hypothetical protein JO071_08925 [Deltaproteobacteria bacterium]|nr:hypothetical protein [Deltaproteobacteria bacterium]
MRISMRIVAGVATGFLLSAAYAPAFANPQNAQDARRVLLDAIGPCEPLSWEAANKLPKFIKASVVECMSPTRNELQASVQARTLLVRAATQMQSDRAVPGSAAETEYEDGIDAYAAGRYVEAIGHLQAAAPLSKP